MHNFIFINKNINAGFDILGIGTSIVAVCPQDGKYPERKQLLILRVVVFVTSKQYFLT